MYQLFSKDEIISKSNIFICYLILKELKKSKEISIFDLFGLLKKDDIKNSNEVIMSLSMLYAMNFIEFKEPFICVK